MIIIMPVQDDFFHKQKRSTVIYSDYPVGTPDISRLIRGKPYWVLPTAAEALKKKALILTNTLMDSWKKEDKEKIKAELCRFIDDGFMIYVWRNGSLIQFNPADPTFYQASNSRPNDVITAASSKLRLARDDITLLDNHVLRQLLTSEKEVRKERSLFLSDLAGIDAAELAKLIDIFAHSIPPLLHVHMDILELGAVGDGSTLGGDFSTIEAFIDKIIKTKHPDIIISKEYQTLILRGHAHFIDGTLTIGKTTLTLDDIGEVTALILNNLIMPSEELQALMKALPRLKNVTTDRSTTLDFLPSQLAELTIPVITVELLKKVPALKRLILNRPSIADLTDSLPEELVLPELEMVEVTRREHHDAPTNLSKLLIKAPNLKVLKLRGGGIIQQDEVFDEGVALLHLEVLDLKYQVLPEKLFTQISPGLKKLRLYCCEYSKLLVAEGITLPCLETISFLNASWGFRDPKSEWILIHLLKSAPNLRTLSFSSISGPELLPEGMTWLHLENLSYDTGHLPIELLKRAPNLKTLTLYDVSLDQSLLKSLKLFKLKTITVAKTLYSDSPGDLKNLLEVAPNLTILRLMNYNFSDTLTPVHGFKLAYLESLSAKNCNISSANLQSLMNLKRLELLDSTIADEPLFVDKFNQLEDIRFSNVKVACSILIGLLKAAPILKRLDLGFSRPLTLEISEDLLWPGLEMLTLEYVNISNNVSLQRLVNASKLKTLSLKNVTLPALSPADFKLENLEQLHLESIRINFTDLQCLLKTAVQLQKLTLINLGIEEASILASELKFPELLVLNLSRSYLTYSNLEHLLKAAPNLQVLDLSHVVLSGAVTFSSDLTLRELRVLNLNGCEINAKELKQLLDAIGPETKIDLSKITCPDADEPLRALVHSKGGFITHTATAVSSGVAEASASGGAGASASGGAEASASGGAGASASGVAGASASGVAEASASGVAGASASGGAGASASGGAEASPSGGAVPSASGGAGASASGGAGASASGGAVPSASGGAVPGTAREPATVSSEEELPVPTSTETPDEVHDPKAYIGQKKVKGRAFKFTGVNKSKNQGMIIEKLSQYLILKKTHLDVIPRLQKGICEALAHYFKDKSDAQWSSFIDRISLWDGYDLSRAPAADFEELYSYVERRQFSQGAAHYVGDHLSTVLDAIPVSSSLILGNPWHTITVRRKGPDAWKVYDPNSNAGVHEVAHADLAKTITTAVGRIISIVSKEDDLKITPHIENPGQFIEEGGLIALYQSVNREAMLAQLTPLGALTKEELEGLLIQSNNTKPAWVLGLMKPVLAPYTRELLAQFMKAHDDYALKLTKSIEHLSPSQRQELMSLIIESPVIETSLLEAFEENSAITDRAEVVTAPGAAGHVKTEVAASFAESGTISPLQKALLEAVRDASIMEGIDYERQLETWTQTTAEAKTLLQYCQQSIANDKVKKRLIQTSDAKEARGLCFALQKHAKDTHRPLFYIDSPDDLVCSAAYVERKDDGTGQLKRGPGGPLHAFLEANRDGKAPILLVNYDKFSSDDLVRFNGLLDKERHADGTALPEDMLVLGVVDTSLPSCYQGSDFYSRFDKVEYCPSTIDAIAAIPALPIDERVASTTSSLPIINLYHAIDWEERLLGRWTLDKDVLIFEEGELTKALREGATAIELQNAPWDDEDFQHFWQQGLATGLLAQGRVPLPKDFRILAQEGYNWAALSTAMTLLPAVAADALVLNSSTLHHFLKRFICEDHQLLSKEGYIQAAKDSGILAVHLTSSLTQDEWAILLSACTKEHVTLHVYCAPGVTLPKKLPKPPATSITPRASDARCRIIESTDIDTTVAREKASGEWVIIDISECSPGALLGRIDGTLQAGVSPKFYFTQKASFLLDALEKNQNIILKGHFSKEFIDVLSPILLERDAALSRGEGAALKGRLVLITDDATAFAYTTVESHRVSSAEKKAAIGLVDDLDAAAVKDLEEHLDTAPLSELQARLRALRSKAASSEEAFQGLETLPLSLMSFDDLDISTSAENAEAFFVERLERVNAILGKTPYVFLTGLSGVGKSTFVLNELSAKDDTVYVGEHCLEDWARDKSVVGRKLLFLDEANLSERQYSEFEGLFNTPPTLFLNGVLHTLTPQHKVVFAGNPISYGDERSLAPFFKRHGNTLIFAPLPSAVLYERALKPIFSGTSLLPHQVALSKAIFKCYNELCNYSSTELLISPRELQMMALMICRHHERHPEHDIHLVAQHVIYDIAASLVPLEKQGLFAQQFKPTQVLPSVTPPLSKDFLITRSRQPIWQAIDERLALREYRTTATNDAQKYGGLGGLVLDGEPGIGKSDIVIQTLIARGYTELKDFKNPTVLEKPFYRLPVSMALNEKKELLLKAFHEGAVVIIDEINSSPMMENLLNELLMGYHQGKRPTRPGFMIIGTQNPITMAGRRASSTALARRLTTLSVTPYPQEELEAILIAREVKASDATLLASTFIKKVQTARKGNFSPEPTLRDLLKLADSIVRASKGIHAKITRVLALPKEVEPVKPVVGSPLAGDDKSANIAKSLKEQLDKIDLMSRNPNQKLEATQQKNQLFSTYLNKITSETKDAPILTLIVKQLKAMSYNAEFKKESVIRALDALSLPKETWESKVIDALKDKRSPLYKALNIKRYGLARLFSFFVGDENSGVSGTLMQLKKEINKLRESKRDDTKQKHKR